MSTGVGLCSQGLTAGVLLLPGYSEPVVKVQV